MLISPAASGFDVHLLSDHQLEWRKHGKSKFAVFPENNLTTNLIQE
jgi:hypothetical protein